ncbi:MAG: hypothetical protein IJ272_04205 [Clostridia bacterium]|nr:hypothetical protein [Clostridia bacterium]
MDNNELKERADIAIKSIEILLEVYRKGLEHWQNSKYCDTDVGQEMIATFNDCIAEAQEEIQAYEQYKETGVFISRQAREILRKAKESKEQDKDIQ